MVIIMDVDKRLQELEQIAYHNLTGEQIEQELDEIDPKLKKEYQKLMSDDNWLFIYDEKTWNCYNHIIYRIYIYNNQIF